MDNGKISRAKRCVGLFAAAAFFAASVSPVQAAWPEKPIRIVVPFASGGIADYITRTVADKLPQKLGQRVIVENKPGPGAIAAALTVLNAPPDGYTMGLAAIVTAISVASFNKLPYDPLTQFQMVSAMALFDMDFAVKADSPYKTLGDFIKAAKAQPGKLNIGTVTIGSSQNFGAELFKSMAGIDVAIVAHHHAPEVAIALLRNDVQLAVEFPPAIEGMIKAKEIRVLATSGAKRSLLSPDVPTVAEAGVADYEVTSWDGIFTAKGTPKEVVDRMNQAIRDVLAMPEVKAQFAKIGAVTYPSTPDELMGLLKADIKKWEKVVTDAKIPKK